MLTWKSASLFGVAFIMILGGDTARPLVAELVGVWWAGKIIAGAQLLSLTLAWMGYSPMFRPLGAPVKP